MEIVRFRSLGFAERLLIAQQTAEKLAVPISNEAARLIADSVSSGRAAVRRMKVAAARAAATGASHIGVDHVPKNLETPRVGFRG